MRAICGAIRRWRSSSPLSGQIQQPLAPVAVAFLLVDIALVDQFLQHPAEALLGDAQDVEQLLHRHAGIAADEMHHPVMGPAEAEFLQDLVRIGHEIAVGEEQQLDQRHSFRHRPILGQKLCQPY